MIQLHEWFIEGKEIEINGESIYGIPDIVCSSSKENLLIYKRCDKFNFGMIHIRKSADEIEIAFLKSPTEAFNDFRDEELSNFMELLSEFYPLTFKKVFFKKKIWIRMNELMKAFEELVPYFNSESKKECIEANKSYNDVINAIHLEVNKATKKSGVKVFFDNKNISSIKIIKENQLVQCGEFCKQMESIRSLMKYKTRREFYAIIYDICIKWKMELI